VVVDGWKNASFLAAETHGAASFARSIEEGELVTIDSIDTIATSLGAKRVAEEAFAWTQRRHVKSHLCSDREAVAGMKAMADAFEVIVEPACGATLSAVFAPVPPFAPASKILVIVCGGATVDAAGFVRYLNQFDLLEP
jgi:L-serine/L-threonine ammonia-lyase